MQFSAAIQQAAPLRSPAVIDLIRRLLSTPEPSTQLPAAPLSVEELPADLDQRVRLVGEW